MMRLKTVADKAVKRNPVTCMGSDAISYTAHLTLVPMKLEVARKSAKYNRVGVLASDTVCIPGDYVLTGLEWYLLGNVSPDVHKGAVIRHSAEMLWCSNTISVQRPVNTKSTAHGGIVGRTASLVFENTKVAFVATDLFIKTERAAKTGHWFLYTSIHAPELQSEDFFIVNSQLFEVKYQQYDMPGIRTYEVANANS
jgi:hypothetical protein